jgi:chemotaxis signal transduction protein
MLGCCGAQGYREFKTSDGYRDDVLAVVLRCHGPLQRTAENMALNVPAASPALTAGASKYATFTVGGQLHAIAADEVRVAYPASAVAPVSAGAMPEHCGMLALRNGHDIDGYIWVADLARMLGMAPAAGEGGQVIVVRHGEHAVGILVDTLDTVAAFADEDIVPAPLAWGGNDVLVRRVIRTGAQLVPVVNADRLRRMLDIGPSQCPCVRNRRGFDRWASLCSAPTYDSRAFVGWADEGSPTSAVAMSMCLHASQLRSLGFALLSANLRFPVLL